MFADSLNLYRGSLDSFGKDMGLPIEKNHVDHHVICRENYEREIVSQKIDVYLKRDCEVLYFAMKKYDELLHAEIGFSILRNNILTTASIAEKTFFSKYYHGGLYTLPEELQNFTQ